MGRAEDIFERLEKEGVAAIDALIRDRQSEELFLDFKRSDGNGSGASLSQTDRKNLSKAISGFGNSAGGIVVWGVDCSKSGDGADVARVKVPLVDAKRFKSWLEDAVSGCTLPPHQGVRHHAIETGKGDEGFVATYIPQSNDAPHQAIRELKYYMRAGSSFVPTPHQILSGMFGRRPQPDVLGHWVVPRADVVGNAIRGELGCVLANRGATIARDAFLTVNVWQGSGPNWELRFRVLDEANWSGSMVFGICFSLIANNGYRLAPGTRAIPLCIEFSIAPPFENDLWLERKDGCDGAPLLTQNFRNSAHEIQRAYDEFMAIHQTGTLSDSENVRIIGGLFGISGHT